MFILITCLLHPTATFDWGRPVGVALRLQKAQEINVLSACAKTTTAA